MLHIYNRGLFKSPPPPTHTHTHTQTKRLHQLLTQIHSNDYRGPWFWSSLIHFPVQTPSAKTKIPTNDVDSISFYSFQSYWLLWSFWKSRFFNYNKKNYFLASKIWCKVCLAVDQTNIQTKSHKAKLAKNSCLTSNMKLPHFLLSHSTLVKMNTPTLNFNQPIHKQNTMHSHT